MNLLQKSHNNKSIFTLLLVACLTAGSIFTVRGNNEKIISKARAAVENASPDDWETYAKSAELCISKNINMKEASKWLDHSLSIKKTTYNLKVKGDYYLKNKLPVKAMEKYLEAIDVGKAKNFSFDSSELQSRIDKARKLQKKLT